MKLTNREYFDKVYGCWLGKCVCGTIGAPYEGMKQRLNLQYSPEMIQKMLPNDDLDLQVLWLKTLEEKGVYTNAQDLAEAFNRYNVLWVGEYTNFKRNYDRGIDPPYTAFFENDYFNHGMGCPIRAEIWGLIFPNQPELAVKYAKMDGSLDHYGESVYFEMFLSAMFSMAFSEKSFDKLINRALEFIPAESRAAKVIRDTVKWCEEFPGEFDAVRNRIIAEYGHSDCTNSFQNMGFNLMCMLMGDKDPIKTALMACNCGFDTDCTAATTGALIGTIIGAEQLAEKYQMKESGYVLSVDYKRPTDSVRDLALDTCRVAKHFSDKWKLSQVAFDSDISELSPKPHDIEIDYITDDPYVQPGKTVTCTFKVRNASVKGKFNVSVEGDNPDFVCEVSTPRVDVSKRKDITVRITLSEKAKILHEQNLFTLVLKNDKQCFSKPFGVIGKVKYDMYGPFWENNRDIDISDGKSYAMDFCGMDPEKTQDEIRFYHINTRSDIDKEYMTLKQLEEGGFKDYYREPKACFVSSIFHFGELTRFSGASTVYLVRKIRLEEDRVVTIRLGYSDAFKFYLNGELLAERSDCANWNPEMVHLYHRTLKAGDNVIVLKLKRSSLDAKFSFDVVKDCVAPSYIVDLNSVI